jgi:hypothetical protein
VPHRRQVSLFKVEGGGSPDEDKAARGPDALPLPSTQGRAYDLTKVRAPWLRPTCILVCRRILVFAWLLSARVLPLLLSHGSCE